jgi:hypothetical protein
MGKRVRGGGEMVFCNLLAFFSPAFTCITKLRSFFMVSPALLHKSSALFDASLVRNKEQPSINAIIYISTKRRSTIGRPTSNDSMIEGILVKGISGLYLADVSNEWAAITVRIGWRMRVWIRGTIRNKRNGRAKCPSETKVVIKSFLISHLADILIYCPHYRCTTRPSSYKSGRQFFMRHVYS